MEVVLCNAVRWSGTGRSRDAKSNRWSDRDLLMRYKGGGIGHAVSLAKPYNPTPEAARGSGADAWPGDEETADNESTGDTETARGNEEAQDGDSDLDLDNEVEDNDEESWENDEESGDDDGGDLLVSDDEDDVAMEDDVHDLDFLE